VPGGALGCRSGVFGWVGVVAGLAPVGSGGVPIEPGAAGVSELVLGAPGVDAALVGLSGAGALPIGPVCVGTLPFIWLGAAVGDSLGEAGDDCCAWALAVTRRAAIGAAASNVVRILENIGMVILHEQIIHNRSIRPIVP